MKKVLLALCVFTCLSYASWGQSWQFKTPEIRFLPKESLTSQITTRSHIAYHFDDTLSVGTVEIALKLDSLEDSWKRSGLARIVTEIWQARIRSSKELLPYGPIVSTTLDQDLVGLSFSLRWDEKVEFAPLLNSLLLKEPTLEEFEQAQRAILEDFGGEHSGGASLDSAFLELFYRYHPYRYGVQGKKLLFENLKHQELTKVFRHLLTQQNSYLVYVGPSSHHLSLEDFWQSLPSNAKEFRSPNWSPESKTKEIELGIGASIAVVLVGYPAPSLKTSEFVPAWLASLHLGDGLSARWFEEIREERNLSYSVGGQMSWRGGPAYFKGVILCQPNRAYKVLELAQKEVEALREKEISSTQLENVKQKARGILLQKMQHPQSRADLMIQLLVLDAYHQTPKSLLEAVDEVSAQDILRASQKYFVDNTAIVARPPGFYFD